VITLFEANENISDKHSNLSQSENIQNKTTSNKYYYIIYLIQF